MNSPIRTYSTDRFRDTFLERNPIVNEIFRKNLNDFFCIKIQDVIPFTKTPIPPSREDCHTLILVEEGVYQTKIGFQEYMVGRGQLAIMQAGNIFSIERMDEELKGFAFHFHPDMLVGKYGNQSLLSTFDFLNVWGNSVVDIDTRILPLISQVFQRLHSTYVDKTGTNFDIVHSYLYSLLFEIKASISQQADGSKNASFYLVQRFKKIIYEKVKENLKVADFAALLNTSPNHLNKCVKNVTGRSASVLLYETKITEAKYLLYQTDMTIYDIANELGFLDQSYFSRFFKKMESMSPTEYKRMIEKC